MAGVIHINVMIKKAFPLPLIGKFIGAGRWELKAPFEYRDPPGYVLVIRVPVGFVSDGASIPRFAWSLIGSPWSGKYARAAVIHDYGYFKQTYSRKKVDDLFLKGMEILGVPIWNRRIMYWCVRVFAWIPWNRYKK